MGVAAIPINTKRRIIGALFATQGLISAAQIASFTVMPLAAVQLTGSEATAGWPSTLTLLGRAAGAYSVGWLMSRTGRRLGLALGYLTAALGFFLSALAIVVGSFALLCLGSIFVGLGRASSDMSRYAAADVELPARKARVIGLVVFSSVIGAIAGPLLVAPSGAMAESRDFNAYVGPNILSVGLALICFAIVELLLRPDPMSFARASISKVAAHAEAATGRSVRVILRARPVQVAVASLVIGQLVMTLLMVITPLYMTHEAHNLQEISWVIMAHTIGMFGLSALTGRMVEKVGAYAVILLGALVLALSAIFTPLAGEVWSLAVALFLLGLGWNLTFVAGSALLTVGLSPGEETRIQGATDTLVALASGVGSFSTGFVFAYGGITAVSIMGLALTLAFGVMAVIAGQRKQLASG
ncbi:MAG: MFS transporter [Caldilineales bacterium]|nr:MFS transporter [Caldilineales bacterium]